MAEGAAAQAVAQTTPAPVGTDGGVFIRNRFTVLPGRPLPELN